MTQHLTADEAAALLLPKDSRGIPPAFREGLREAAQRASHGRSPFPPA